TTDLRMDNRGNFRLDEQNDQDGGRLVIVTGDEIAVQLRYGKLIRRPAREDEALETLAQAVGGPFSAWELGRRRVHVEATEAVGKGENVALMTPADHVLSRYRLTLSAESGAREPAGTTPTQPRQAEDLQAWRNTVNLGAFEGSVTLAVGK